MARPRNARDKAPRKTAARKMAAQASARGITPLDVMLEAMRHYAGLGDDGQPIDRDKAVMIAEKAAPYVHARLAQVDASFRADVATTHRFVMMGAPEAPNATSWEAWCAAVKEQQRSDVDAAKMSIGEPPSSTANNHGQKARSQ